MNRFPMTRVFETFEELDIKFPATAGEATYDSPIVFKWSDDIEPYSYIEKNASVRRMLVHRQSQNLSPHDKQFVLKTSPK